MSKTREKSASKNKGFFKLNTVKKKMIAGFMLLTLINIIAFLAFQMYSTYGQVKEEALDKSYAYAEHIEKIISPIGISQAEKLQSKISSLLTEQYKTAAYIGVLDSNLKYVANTDKTKIGTEFKTEETENAIKANKSISFTINSKGNKEYISIVPLYDVTMVSGVDSEASATAKVDVPGLVIVSMDTGLMLSHEKAEFLKIIGIGCILLAFSIAIAAIISREITNPLKGVRNHLHEMAEGDFTKAVIVKSNDELLDLANDLNKTNVVLKDMISDIKSTAGVLNKYSQELNNSTNNIAGASEEISQSMDEIAGSSACQSDNLSNTVSTVNIFSTNLDNINSNIHGIKGDSIQIKEIADDERYKIKELLSAMKEVQNCFEAVKNKIDNLSNSVGQIHLITETINSVAKQTNLLSLNASIEAARAGKEGGGFLVVAHEVGKLAEQTLQAANNISNLIRNISESTNVVAVTATEAINKVQTQAFIISDTVTKFNGIVDKVNIVIPQINQVAETLDETIAMKDDILMNIKSIASASEGMAASAEQVSALTQEQSATILNLSSLSEQLNMTSDSMLENIDKFKVE